MSTGKQQNKSHIGIVLFSFLLLPLLVGCNSDGQYFTSGLAKEWAQQQPVTIDKLATSPDYYLRGLGDDLGQLSWLAIPKGKLFNDMRDQHRIEDIRALLVEYVELLQMLPQHNQLPEYQLSQLYLGLANDYVAYIKGDVSMYSITNKIANIDDRAQQYENYLAEADDRRLEVMLNTLSQYQIDNEFYSNNVMTRNSLLAMNREGKQ